MQHHSFLEIYPLYSFIFLPVYLPTESISKANPEW